MSQQTTGRVPDADLDAAGQAEIEGRPSRAAEPSDASAGMPAAGPHAERSLTNPDATPGAGTLPSPSADDEAAAGTG